jgi:hypothetical protein
MMRESQSPGGGMNIVTRVVNILLLPTSEWPVIAEEETRSGDLFYGYVMIMALIPALSTLIGYSLVAGRISFGFGLIGAILQYCLSLGAISFVALVAQWLSPKFSGRDDLDQAMKLVAYAHTPSWVGGAVFLYPPVAMVSLILVLWGAGLAFLGATPVMAVPPRRALPYTLAIIFTVLIVFFLVSLVMSIFLGLGMMTTMI